MLSRLLERDPEKRLGSGELDAEEIKSHEFFVGMNWADLETASLTPPWRPNVAGSLDVSQFDPEFTNLPLGDSTCEIIITLSITVASTFILLFLFIILKYEYC